MDDVKQTNGSSDRLLLLQKSLLRVEAFLRRYSPLTNAHSSDFITHELWKLLPKKIESDLHSRDDWHEIPQKCIEYREMAKSGRNNDNDVLASEDLRIIDSHAFNDGVFDKTSRCVWISSHEDSLDSFLSDAMACTVEASGILTSLETLTDLPTSSQSLPFVSHSMGIKKSHEIEKMSSFTAQICHNYGISRVVDVGSGKGYLGTYLNLTYGLQVIELDSVQSNIEGSVSRRIRLEERWDALRSKAGQTGVSPSKRPKMQDTESAASVISITRQVESPEQLDLLISGFIHDESPTSSCVVTGLHTCGHLAMSAIDTFLRSKVSRALINIGCCYHLFDELNYVDTYIKHKPMATAPKFPLSNFLRNRNKPKPFVLGRNARMIASQSIDRMADPNETLDRNMYYRIMLQQLLKDHLGFTSNDWIVGKIGKKNATMTFISYVRKALAKLKFTSLSEKLSDEDITTHEKLWLPMERTFYLFYVLRCCLGTVVESCILLDRLCYLLEQASENQILSQAHLFKVFDPLKSPRCYALFALKDVCLETSIVNHNDASN